MNISQMNRDECRVALNRLQLVIDSTTLRRTERRRKGLNTVAADADLEWLNKRKSALHAQLARTAPTKSPEELARDNERAREQRIIDQFRARQEQDERLRREYSTYA